MGDEFNEIDIQDISSDIGSDVSVEADFTPAEGLEDTDVEEVEEDVDFTPAEGLEDTAIEDVEEDVVLTPAEGLEDTAIEDVDEDVDLTSIEESDDKDIDLSAEENEESSDDGAPVKVLRMDGKETSIHKHNGEEELANLDAGIRNAYQPYSDVASEIYDDYKDVADDPDISSREKIEALQQDREKLEELKSEWEDESADWYEEGGRLQHEIQEQAEDDVIEDMPEAVYEDEAAEDLSEGEYAEEIEDMPEDVYEGEAAEDLSGDEYAEDIEDMPEDVYEDEATENLSGDEYAEEIEDVPEDVYDDEVTEDIPDDEYDEEASELVDDSELLDGYDDGISGLFEPGGDMDAADESADNMDIDNATDRNDDDEWEPQPRDVSDVSEPLVDVVPLEETRQIIQTVDLPDGSWERVFDHPEQLQAELPFEQGKNEYGKEETCALANLGTWLEIGGSVNKENDIVAYASTHMDMDGDPLCSESGGVYPGNIPTIWKNFGVDAYNDSSKNLEHIAEAVESGHAVSVGVNAGKLYENDNSEAFDLNDSYGDGGANHQIGIVSCVRDGVSGNITHFYINDTGRSLSRDACRRVPVQDLYNAVNVKRGVATISKKPIW